MFPEQYKFFILFIIQYILDAKCKLPRLPCPAEMHNNQFIEKACLFVTSQQHTHCSNSSKI